MIAVSKGETIEHYVSRRISGVPGGACSAALSKRSSCAARWRQWPPGRVSFRPGWANAGGLCLQRAAADGTPTDVRLSELFAPGKGSLVIYSMMFPCYSSDERPGTESGQTALRPLAEGSCPSYTAFLDQLDGAAEPATQRVNFVVVTKAPLQRILTFAKERGWRRLRLLSSAGNSYNRDCLGEIRTETKCRCGTYSTATASRCATSGARSSSTRPPAQGRVPATTAPSSRSGTFSTSLPRDVRPTGTRMSFMIASRN